MAPTQPSDDRFWPKAWRKIKSPFGRGRRLREARTELEALRKRLADQEAAAAQKIAGLEKELNEVREERLRWIAKESSTRKDLNDCQERSKELLEQVVRLTHQERMTKQNLLDHQFKTSTTPLERNRFEMELTEARVKVKEAEERVRRAEEKAARAVDLEKQVMRLKPLESELDWVRQQSAAHLKALGAAILRIQALEAERPAAAQHTAQPRIGARRPYHMPELRAASRAQQAALIGAGQPS
jgi:chromosome segregation ATPase